jgi:disulfide bond formation protein DsbB
MMQNLLFKLFSMPNAALLIMAAGIGSLLFALTLQYGFDVAPCQLCLWQRVPFAVTALLALIAIVVRPYGKTTRLLLDICIFLFLANAGLALFHSGVERHWWEWHSSCTGSTLDRTKSLEDLRQELLGKPVVRCDEISWTLLGFSMANWNIPFSLALALFVGMAARFKGFPPR